MANNVHFMSYHFIDTGGSVSINHHTTIAGRDTQFWSHGRALVDGVPQKKTRMRLNIGSRVYLGARATIVGIDIPDRAIVGAGSIVTKSFPVKDCHILIAGKSATIKKRYQAAGNIQKPKTLSGSTNEGN